MEIHHDDAIFSPPGRPGGAVLDAGGIIALIAQQHNGFVLIVFLRYLKLMFWKDLFIRLPPDPFDLFLEGPHIGHIVDTVTGVDTIPASFVFPAFAEINPHPPSLPG
jgi:hypothetical protein